LILARLNTLAARLAERIARGGPITVADYMAAALSDPDHGYYRTADPLGAGGDFTTAPEISQLFGELVGAWLIDCWEQAGRPGRVNLVELGPGRGTLMADIMRVGRHAPDWLKAVQIHLVEINPRLRQAQAEILSAHAPQWHAALSAVPDGPIMLVANEFLDALPIRQLVFWNGAWRERLVGWSAEAGFRFVVSSGPSALSLLLPADLPAAQGDIYELSPAVIGVGTEIAQRIARDGGAALIVDYGRTASAAVETLQAVRAHRMVRVLDDPGVADLSAHVDFALLARVACETGAIAAGPATQGEFLEALGIGLRAERIKRGVTTDAAATLDQAVARLTDPKAMGHLFKVLAIVSPGVDPAGLQLC
jgi:NADH dehydrogenase [ubiquinone] 1 alpha subcomplex assembly factor 7